MPRNDSLKNRGLVPTIEAETDFSWTCSFCWVLDNVEHIMYIKFQETFNDWMQRNRQNSSIMPPKWGLPPIVTPQDFFQRLGSVTFVPLRCPNFMQKDRNN